MTEYEEKAIERLRALKFMADVIFVVLVAIIVMMSFGLGMIINILSTHLK